MNLRVPRFLPGSGYRPHCLLKISSHDLMCMQTVEVCIDSDSAGLGEVSGSTFIRRFQVSTVLLHIQEQQCSQDAKVHWWARRGTAGPSTALNCWSHDLSFSERSCPHPHLEGGGGDLPRRGICSAFCTVTIHV